IRNCFRAETEQFEFSNALEIGFGTGIDLIYFAQKFPNRKFYGLDISQGMHDRAKSFIEEGGMKNITIDVGSVESVQKIFPDKKFEHIYVYFGALNTVSDLPKSAEHLSQLLAPEGKMVITVINKWYILGMLLPLLKGRFSIAFQRVKNKWRGYSPKLSLESQCYTPSDIKKAFHSFEITRHQGYSILFPPWYDSPRRKNWGRLKKWLWSIDRLLNRTPFWKFGEYSLFVMKHR